MNKEKEIIEMTKNLYVNNPSSKIVEKIKNISNSKNIFEKRIETKTIPISNNISRLNKWKIKSNFFIVGPITNKKTDFDTLTNDIEDVKNFINENGSKETLYISTKDYSKVFQNFFLLVNFEFNCENISNFCNAVEAWFEINNNNFVIVELDLNKISFFTLIIECFILYFTKIENDNIFVLEKKIFREKISDIETIKRFKSYFFNLVNYKKSHKFDILLLHQLIISNYPKIKEFLNFKIILEIHQKNNKIVINEFDNNDVIYKDQFYIIFTNLKIELEGDANIIIFFNDLKVFEFPFNCFLYEQGLFRYNKEDIITNYFKYFDEDFKFDIVLLDINKMYSYQECCPFQKNIILGIEVLTNYITNSNDKQQFEKLIQIGYNRHIAKFCAQMNYNEIECQSLVNNLEAKGYKNLIQEKKPEKLNSIKYENKEKNDKESAAKDYIKKIELYKNIKSNEIKKIDLIIDEIYIPPQILKTKTKGSFKKKNIENNISKLNNIHSIRPLHWVPVMSSKNTIFKNLDSYNINYDIEKFKKHFCVLNEKVAKFQNELKPVNNIIDSKRLFLVSLALKHLNKKHITSENIYNILKNNSKNIFIQDLLNLERMFPTYEEAYMLATSEFDKLSYEEKTMLKFSKLTEVNKLVKILIFERKFFDEIFLLEELLDKFRYTFEKLINSEEIKILLKMLLDLGNMINSDFLGRTKKLSGFKLSSINLFFDYKGQNDYNLFKYLMECIDDKNMIENLIKDFKYLDFVRKEHLSKIKDKINFFIIQYSENLEIFYSLEYDKETFKNFLVFVSDKLDDIKIKYEECVIQANKIKIMFDENDKKNVIEILDNIGTLISKVINYKNSSNV